MATITSNGTGGGNWSATTTWSGGVVPVDGDAVVIAAGDSVRMDVNQSAFTGLQNVTINGSDGTPGMLYFCDGQDGTLKIRTGYKLQGTSTGANKGRLLANSDGSWGGTGCLSSTNKAVFLFEGTAYLYASNLDVALYCAEPTHKYVRTYGTKKTVLSVNTATDELEVTSHGWAVDTAVMVMSSGQLPAPLEADYLYFISPGRDGDHLTLARRSGGPAVDITSSGTGTIEIYDGATINDATLNVFEDITGDTPWTTTSGHNAVSLVNFGPQPYDQQRNTVTGITTSLVTLGTATDSVQKPGARIYLVSRNVSIRSSHTSTTVIIVSGARSKSVFNCEIRATAGSGNTFYANGFTTGSNGLATFGGVICGCAYAVPQSYRATINSVVVSCSVVSTQGTDHTFNGDIAGCAYAIYQPYRGIKITGLVLGCSYVFHNGIGYVGTGVTLENSAVVKGCKYLMGPDGFYSGFQIAGMIRSCQYLLNLNGGNNLITADMDDSNIYHIHSDSIKRGLPNYAIRNAAMSSPLRETTTRGSSNAVGRYCIESYNRVAGDDRIWDVFGDILRTACNGNGDAPSADPGGGNGACIEASNIQANCNQFNPLRIIDGMRVWLPASTRTITIKVQTTYAGITAGNLKLTCQYVGANGALTETTHAPAINQRTSAADWSQTLYVTITPSVEGWATFTIDLMEYESGNEVYVWPEPSIAA